MCALQCFLQSGGQLYSLLIQMISNVFFTFFYASEGDIPMLCFDFGSSILMRWRRWQRRSQIHRLRMAANGCECITRSTGTGCALERQAAGTAVPDETLARLRSLWWRPRIYGALHALALLGFANPCEAQQPETSTSLEQPGARKQKKCRGRCPMSDVLPKELICKVKRLKSKSKVKR